MTRTRFVELLSSTARAYFWIWCQDSHTIFSSVRCASLGVNFGVKMQDGHNSLHLDSPRVRQARECMVSAWVDQQQQQTLMRLNIWKTLLPLVS